MPWPPPVWREIPYLHSRLDALQDDPLDLVSHDSYLTLEHLSKGTCRGGRAV